MSTASNRYINKISRKIRPCIVILYISDQMIFGFGGSNRYILARKIDRKRQFSSIFLFFVFLKPKPPVHFFCRCSIELMKSITAGTATINGHDGADWKLMFKGTLPEYYVSLQEALAAKWNYGKWPSNFVPGKMITMGKYQNKNGHLPSAPNRQWYEADINYTTGKRNSQRIVRSNDGLIFTTYDHYVSFYEIIGG